MCFRSCRTAHLRDCCRHKAGGGLFSTIPREQWWPPCYKHRFSVGNPCSVEAGKSTSKCREVREKKQLVPLRRATILSRREADRSKDVRTEGGGTAPRKMARHGCALETQVRGSAARCLALLNDEYSRGALSPLLHGRSAAGVVRSTLSTYGLLPSRRKRTLHASPRIGADH